LFILPAPGTQGARLLNWEDAKHIRYDIILMFGSGFALAHAFEVSGLSLWISHSLVYLKDAPNWLLITGACALITLVSEFASNIASIQLMIPVLTALLPYINVTPLQLLWPATFAASLGFMLPIATAANTLVYGTRQIILKDMLRIGLLLDLIGIALIVLFHCM
jgi:sodium-dependent dicarboxylate transporter 2/3/5